jgi:hypothetical protein
MDSMGIAILRFQEETGRCFAALGSISSEEDPVETDEEGSVRPRGPHGFWTSPSAPFVIP